MKKCFFILVLLLTVVVKPFAQVLTWTTDFPRETDNISIVVDATKGNKGLQDYSNPDDVYVHIGVITSYSSGPSDWKYVKFPWASTGAAKAISLGNNKYQFNITGIKSFFGVSSNEQVKKICILFRNGSGSLVQRNADGSDMFIPIYTDALTGRFDAPPTEPKYLPSVEPIQKSIGDKLKVTFKTNKSANIKLWHNSITKQNQTGVLQVEDSITITNGGKQEIIAYATNGSSEVFDTLRFFVAPPPVVASLPAGLRDGINYESGDTSAVLVLYAPNKSRVAVLGDFNGWQETISHQMNRTPDGKRYWLRITGLTPGTEYGYQYQVDGVLKIADPYTEKVLDPYNDLYINAITYPNLKAYPMGKTTGNVSVIQTAKPAYNWQIQNFQRPDKRSLVIYELLLRDFLSNHDWKTLKDTLPYLKKLGINAIEMMPFNEFEGNQSWGYNPSFYFAPDKYYGTETSLKQFVDECHKQGIAVIMDIALNHSFGQSPLVQLYWDGPNNRPAADNPWFNPVAKHAYNVGYDMNHESLDTRAYSSRIMEHWLTNFKIDGFRFDLSKGFTQNTSCDLNGNNCNVSGWGMYDVSRIAIWKKYYDTCQNKSPGSYVILEHFADNNEEKELSAYGMMLWGNMNYNFSEATAGYTANSNFEGALFTQRGWTNPHLIGYMESHDEERLMYKNITYGTSGTSYNIKNINTALARNEMAAAFLFSMPGPKMIWQFGELGYDYSINYCTNGTISNNCRLDSKPVFWDNLQDRNHLKLKEVYTGMLQLRKHPLFKNGFITNRVESSLTGSVKWFKLTTDTSNILVVGNFDVSSQTTNITFQNAGTWYDYFSDATIAATGAAQSITLKPGEYHVYVNRNVTYNLTTVLPTPVSVIDAMGNKTQLNVYPNPVSRSSIIQYDLPSNGLVNIQLFDLSGRLIQNISNGFKTKGVYRIPLNEIKVGSSMQVRGIYLLQMEFDRKKLVQKIILD